MSELLMGMRLNGIRYRRLRLAQPFGIGFGGPEGKAQFHFVAQGSAILRLPDGVRRIECGDAVFLPHGPAHALQSSDKAMVQDLAAFSAAPICAAVEAVSSCPDGTCRTADTIIFSGCMDFDLGSMHPLVAMMPQVMQLSMLAERQPEIIPILEAMEREACTERAGFAGILARLADVVAASIVRGWVECGCGSASGWVEALRDPHLGRVLQMVHRDPGRTWTVAALAAEMGVSRSVFAARFVEVTGVTPLGYVTELRMRLAGQWIAQDGLSIEAVALRLGYSSQAAFSRAFKRVVGAPPGSMR
ncbi:MAG TPA: AraC family transcriptional regulator [Paenirhodobacter sp.]